MPLTVKPTRYAHPEGHTDVCYYTGEKGGLVTCGADGDVRSWLNLMDDDPASSCISEQATTIISKNGKLYVGTDNNTVQILSYPDLEKEGIVTRFSSTISALATATNSNLIASGACDMRIQVTNIETSDSIELNGHVAPISGLTLDPKEEFVASSSVDGTLRVWSIEKKQIVHVWDNIVPKCNSFFTAKLYCTPSFHCKDGRVLAYPHKKDVVVVERGSWKELFRLKCSSLNAELSICKFSNCATRIAASSALGEIVVWDFESKRVLGYVEHQQNAKVTSITWRLGKPDELAFCDSLGQLGCVDVSEESTLVEKTALNTGADENVFDDNRTTVDGDDDDDDGENVISLNKIKASVNLEDDQKSITDSVLDKIQSIAGPAVPQVNLQKPFQPGSSPAHLLSRFMVWNDTGMVRCYMSEDGEDSSIEVEFHDTTVHHAMYIKNYLGHTLAALSPQVLALACPSGDGVPSKIVAVVLQGWGSGNKEWSIDLPEDEEAQCLAAGDNFIALSTSRQNLRLFMVGGTQREVIALPGPVVAINAYKDHLVVCYHAGLGASGDQHMNVLWLRIRGANLRNVELSLPLSPSSELSWLGLTDLGSPTAMDSDGVIKIYDKKSRLWRVACDTDRQGKGKSNHFFIIGVTESERVVRCVLCKGSHYPPTTPRPAVVEIPLIVPLCEPDSEKSEKEARLWQLGSNPLDENEALLFLFALACRSNVEYRAVELCQQIASQNVIELAMKYAGRINRMALANKLESIVDSADRQQEQNEDTEDSQNGLEGHNEAVIEDDEDEPVLTPVIMKPPEVEIRPLSLGVRRSNPFLKSGNSTLAKGLSGLNSMPEKPQKPKTPKPTPTKTKQKKTPQKESFVSWFAKHKKDLEEEFSELSTAELTNVALKRFKEGDSPGEEILESKKRKLSESDTNQDKEPKRSTTSKLADFSFE